MGRPQREKPDDFRRVFVMLGWEGTPDHYGTHSSVVARWVDEEGRDDLTQARRRHVSARRRSNYVLGRRLSSLKRAYSIL